MKKWDLYKLAIEQFREHPRIYWIRNSFFMSIQTALIAFAIFDLKNPSKIQFVHFVMTFIGLVIAIVWLHITKASRKLLSTWREIVLQIERECFDKEKGLFHRSMELGEGTSFGISITSAMICLAGFFVFAWCILLVFVGLQVIR